MSGSNRPTARSGHGSATPEGVLTGPEPGPSRLARWARLLPLLLLLMLSGWQYRWLGAGLSAPINHGRNEDWDWQLTLYEVSRKALLEFHELPFWNPYTHGGVPLWANPEAAFLYPPFALVLIFGTDLGLKLWILVHLWLLVGAAWMAGRELGLSTVASSLAPLFLLCSAWLPGFIAVGHVMFLPIGWLLLAWVAMRRGRWPLAAAALALSFLAGGHYLLIYGTLWLSIDALLRGVVPERLKWLAVPLMLNLALMGQGWAIWPVGVAFLGAVCVQRPARLRRTLTPLVLAGLLAGLLLGAKLATAPPLFSRSERLVSRAVTGTAVPYTAALAWDTVTGVAERPGGHEGPNVFWSGIPVVLGMTGLAWASWQQPAWGLLGLIFLNLGWGSNLPINMSGGLHRLPGFDLLRVVERYSLLWTLFLGFGAGWLLDRCVQRWGGRGAAPIGAALLWWVHLAAPQAMRAQQLGPGPDLETASGQFFQTGQPSTNYQAVRLNQGRIDCGTAIAQPASPALSSRERSDYRGEVYMEAGNAVEAAFTPSSVTVQLDQPGRVIVNQNAYPGWQVDRRPADTWNGLLSATLPAGEHIFRYRPPGLWPGVAASVVGLILLIRLRKVDGRADLVMRNLNRTA